MNVFLSTSLFAKVIDGKPDTIDIHFGRGWSFWPGHIHAKKLSIRGRDGNVEWILRLDDVEFDVSFVALFHQRFSASHIYGSGLSFRLRQRLDAPPSSPAEIADLPPIEGLAPYAIHPPPQPEPEIWSDAAYHLWSADLEDVVADEVREVWVDNLHFEGSARIAGRFYLKPIRRAEIGPIRIDVKEGHVRTGESVLLEGLGEATVDVTLAPFDPRIVRGTDLLRKVSLAAGMHPRFPDIARLHVAPEETAITGEIDVRQLALQVRDGAVQAGTRVDASFPRAVMTRGEHRFLATIDVAGAVTRDHGDEGDARLDFRARLSDLDVARNGATRTPGGVFLHVPQATVTGDSRQLDLANTLADVHMAFDVPEGQMADVRALSPYIPRKTPLALKGGRGLVSGHFETWRADAMATGRAKMHVDDLGLELGTMRVQGTASADASFASFRWETSHLSDARLSLHVSRGMLALERSPGTALVRVGELRIDARAAEVALDDPLRALGATIVIDAGEVVDPDLLRAYLPKGSEMHILPGRARFSLTSALTLANHLARGTLDVSSRGLGFSFRDFHVGFDLLAKARVHDWHWERGDLVLDQADVDVTHVSVYRPGREEGDALVQSAGDRPPSTPTGRALSFGRISLGATSSHFAFADPLAEVALTASLAGAQVHDSAIVNAFLPAGAPFVIRANDGVFSTDIQAEIRKHVLRGTIAVRAANMGIGGKALQIVGDVDLLAHVSGWDFATSTIAVEDAHVLFSHVAGRFGGGGTDGSGAALGSARAMGKLDFRAEGVELWASTPALDLMKPSRKNVDGRLAIVGAELPDATVLERFLPANAIMAVEFGGARVSGNLEFSSMMRTARGRLDIDLEHAGIRFHETHLAGTFQLSARLLGYDPDHGLLNISGTRFSMRDVQVTNASTDTLQWAGDAVFSEATFRLDPQPELDGMLSVEARDASPILAILLGNGLPKIFVGLTRMPHLSAASRLTMGARHVALRDLDAHGGDLSIRGIYVIGQNHRAGAFVVGKGPFSAGFRLDDEGAHLRLFGLQGWLRDETSASMRLFDEPMHPSPRPAADASP